MTPNRVRDTTKNRPCKTVSNRFQKKNCCWTQGDKKFEQKNALIGRNIFFDSKQQNLRQKLQNIFWGAKGLTMIDLKKLSKKMNMFQILSFIIPFFLFPMCFARYVRWTPKKRLPYSRALKWYDFIFHFLLASKPSKSKGLEWYHWEGSTMP